MAIMIFVMFGLGWYMTDLELTDPNKFRLYQIHKAIGIIILALAVLRLLWRMTHTAPPWPETMTGWERLAATGAHWALYGLIFLQPIIGILQSNAANFPIVLFGQVELPAIVAQSKIWDERLLSLHHLLANALAAVVLVHVAAALRHHFMLKEDILRRMLPAPGLAALIVVLGLAGLAPAFIYSETTEPMAAATKAATSAPALESSTGQQTEAPAHMVWSVEEGSALGFEARQQGSPVKGGFERFDATIVFDPDDLDNSRLAVDIDATSITTGHDDRDKTLNSPSFFDTATWPNARFASREIIAVGNGAYEALGELTIRDVTMPVTLPFALEIEPDPNDPARELASARGDLPILRLDYGVGQGDWTSTTTVADEVVIKIDIKASRAP
jgi:cytochrome b561/polyisoprenoid-binding protein YceI